MSDEQADLKPRRGARLLPHSRLEPTSSRRRQRRRSRLFKPTILGIRIGPLLSIYASRLRRHGLQELLAAIGIAIGVALMFGVLVSSQSITGSAGRILHAITGKAQLQVTARSPKGFEERIVEEIGQLPGIKVAAPLLRVNAVVEGSAGRQAIQLVGSTASQFDLEGSATRFLGSQHLDNGVALTSTLAAQVDAQLAGTIQLLARGRDVQLPVHGVWDSQDVGALASSSIAVGPLSVIQQALDLPHRVSEVLIVPMAGREAQARQEIETLVGGKLDVQSAQHELRVLDAVAQPSTESSRLFAAIGAIVGFLFAVNAMLLTVPDRRRWVADARTQGYSAGQVVAVLGFQALALGVVASVFGVLIGYVLAKTIFSAIPGFLTLSFPIGTQPIIDASTVAAAAGAGIIATLVASAAPLRDLSPGRPIDAVFHGTGKVGQSIAGGTVILTGSLAALLIAATIVLVMLLPGLSILGVVVLSIGALSAVPALLVVSVALLMPGAERLRRSMLAVALSEVQGTATRSIALAGVAALAVYGSVAVNGARDDLVRGLDAATVQFLNTAEVWVTPTGNNPFLTDSFNPRPAAAAVLGAPGVTSVRTFQAAFLDVGSRRLWIRARPIGDRTMIQASQLLAGNLSRATAQIRAGGWAAVSSGFASERHIGIDGRFLLPTPAGSMPLRVAALTTNSGWPPGAITISQPTFERYWQTSDPTALEVNFESGTSPTAGRQIVRRALSAQAGLHVQTLAEREAQNERDARQGVQSLSEISTLILIAAGLAIMFALSAAIAARRIDIASRKAEGYEPLQLWRMMLLESAVVLGVGALDGALLGIGGHALAGRWLRLSQGFPAPFSFDPAQLLLTLGIVAAVTIAVVAVAGYPAALVGPRLSVEE